MLYKDYQSMEFQMTDDDDLENEICDDIEDNHNRPMPQTTLTENDAIHAMISGSNPFSWPIIINHQSMTFKLLVLLPVSSLQCFPMVLYLCCSTS